MTSVRQRRRVAVEVELLLEAARASLRCLGDVTDTLQCVVQFLDFPTSGVVAALP